MAKNWIDWEETPQIKPDEGEALTKDDKGTGEQAIINQLAKLVKGFDRDAGPTMRQATNEEQIAFLKSLNPDLVDTEEELKDEDEEWSGRLNKFYEEVRKPVELKKTEEDTSWGSRGPITEETKTEEEERISAIPVNGNSGKGEY